jgi:hypothetical protein
VHTNPAKIAGKLPQADRIAATDKRRFSEQVRGLQTQFAAYANQNNLARQDDTQPVDSSTTKSL